jgi:hypothetical protein
LPRSVQVGSLWHWGLLRVHHLISRRAFGVCAHADKKREADPEIRRVILEVLLLW